MSIASRITTMTEHIDDIYDTVELTGVDTTGVNKNLVNVPNTLKDGFVDIINNGVDTLYENFPKVAQTREEPTLNGVYEAPMRVDLNGNTEQDSYSGKNLLKVFSGGEITVNNITIKSNNNGTFILNGTPSVLTYIEIIYAFQNGTNSQSTPKIELDSSKQYTVSIDTKVSGIQFSIQKDNSSNQINVNVTNNNNTFTSSNGIYRGYLRISENTTFNNEEIKLQIEEGSTATNYEPYVGGNASPNPDYPQDIRVVKGDNTIKVTGKNLSPFTFQGGYLTNAGVVTSNYTRGITTLDYIEVKPNTDYTLSFNLSSANLYSNSFICTYDANKTFIQRFSMGADTYPYVKTIRTNENAKYIMACIYTGSDNTIASSDISNWQFEKSSTPTTYQPYQEQTYQLDLGTTEVCKIGDYKDVIRKSTGKNLIGLGTQLNGYRNVDTGTFQGNSNAIGYYFETSKLPNTITFNCTGGNRANISYYNEIPTTGVTSQDYSRENDLPRTINVNKTYTYIHIQFSYNETNVTNIQIEEGSRATDYEPYGNVWYKKGYIGKVVLDGSEDIERTGTNTTNKYRFIIGIENANMIYVTGGGDTNYILSDKLIAGNRNSTYATIQCICYGNGSSTYKNLIAYIEETSSMTKEQFKTWLSTHNTEVYYVLATPTTTEITDTDLIAELEALKTAKSVEGQTNITQTNEELPFILDVSGLKKD